MKIAIAGAQGRMGQAVAKIVEAHPGLEIAARFERPGVEGEGLVSLDEALATADVVIDFTTPQASATLAAAAAARGGPALVIGSTGLSPRDLEPIHAASQKIAIVRSGSFSLGINILIGLVRQTAGMLGPEDWDIEVFEAHHRHKVDAPSGTAMMLGEAAAQGRGVDLGLYADRVRDGITGERRPGAIGFSVMRGGGIVGEHSVSFAGAEEIITFAHSARDRGLFARGAAQAAVWVAGRGPGLYDMQDVLGFSGE